MESAAGGGPSQGAPDRRCRRDLAEPLRWAAVGGEPDAKDLSQHAHRVPGAVEASEDVAAILALAERNLLGS